MRIADISPFIAGCERVRQQDGRLIFDRLPEPLAAEYRAAEGSRIRLECPAAVRLRFITDARAIRLKLHFGAMARPFYRCGLTVDGSVREPVGPDGEIASWEGDGALADDGTEHLVELWLPHTARTDIAGFELVDATTPPRPAPAQETRWLAMGDSITQGMTAELPTDTYVARCARALDLDVHNYGIGGARMARFLAEHAIDWPYDLMTVAYGTNDFNGDVSLEEHAGNLSRFIERQAADHPSARFVVITPPPLVVREDDRNALGLQPQDYREAAATAVAELPLTAVIHGTDLVPTAAEWFTDGVHPNTAGMECYARGLVPVLRAFLGQ